MKSTKIDPGEKDTAIWDKELNMTGGLLSNGQIEKLKGNEPFTIFAPMNLAVANRSTLLTQFKFEESDEVAALLDNHIVKGLIPTRQLQVLPHVEALSGSKLSLTRKEDGVFVGDARVLRTIECDNGIIHVIDRFLVPQYDVVKTAASDKKFKKWSNALKLTNLAKTFQADKEFTFLAPTDNAFDKLPYGSWTRLLKPEHREDLVDLVMSHVLDQRLQFDAISKRDEIETMNQSLIRMAKSTQGVFLHQAKL
ncbi:MAG: fasciclin domain-containing protein, partial [Verrucomicrobiota bacterium]